MEKMGIADKCLLASDVLHGPLTNKGPEHKSRRMGDEKGWVFATFPEIFAPQPHFVKPGTSEEDLRLFFDEVPDNLIEIQDGWTMAHVVAAAGWFSSISEARKNGGWHKEPIPAGFSCWISPDKSRCLWIYNKP